MKLPLVLAAASLVFPLVARSAETAAIQRVARVDVPGTTASVRVPDVPLVFTGQIFAQGAKSDAAAQTADMLDALRAKLQHAGATEADVVRLNLYLSDEQHTAAVEKVVAARFAPAPPAVTWVRSPLARAGALVACDAVAVSRAALRPPAGDEVAMLPAGGKIFISGQAKRAAELKASVAETMAALHASLAQLGADKRDVVQVKGFITPFAEEAVVRAEIVRSFGEHAPPIVLIEWLSDTPAEIELVAADRAATKAEAATYLGLPGMTNSPYFSRVTKVAAGTPLIFVAGIDGGTAGDARQQWQRVFAELGGTLMDAGSSFRHLVKATYYLADPKARQALGDIRGVYYDPARPPAASALDVKALCRPGAHVALDMIAVPRAEAAK